MIEKDGSNFGLSLNNTISQAYKQKRESQCFSVLVNLISVNIFHIQLYNGW